MVYTLSRITIIPFLKLWLGKVEGKENIPKDKPFIFAANHSSYYETLLVPSVIVSNVDKRLHAWVDSIYWDISFTRFFLEMWQMIPVHIEKQKDRKTKNKIAFKKAVSCLRKGNLMMIFPEGKRNTGKTLSKGYTGIAKLAISAKVPVLPVGIIGANKILPKGAAFPRFKKCRVKIGKPMYFEKYYNKQLTKKTLEQVTREIMKEIGNLSGLKYTH